MLLTGATGFVGPHAVDAFTRAGASVRALVRSPARAAGLGDAEIVQGSLEDDEALARACSGIDVVVHMAALTHARTDAEYHAVNAAGTARLLDAALGADPAPRRLVYLSSLAACGPAVDGRGVTAGDLPRPLTAYGRSKLEGERVVLAASDRIETVIVRAPAVYGPRDTDLFHFFRLARWGFIPVPTGADRPLQLVHVEDLARGLVHAATAARATDVYHVAEARSYTWQEVGSLVGAAVGRKRVRVARVPAPLLSALAAVSETAAGLVGRSSIFNRDKARELLAPGWLCETDAARADLEYEAAIPLADGLRSTAQWYRENGWL
ncbi:MAG TPA: NAD-dependent epimerase/dehydratase family protein [Longimicrobiales bacterium]|nr:NAD-dependent epimerase/dehydratase family protein [Longimicrobiales bacterium]